MSPELLLSGGAANQLDQPMIGDDCDDHNRKSVHSISQSRRLNNPKVLCSTRASCDVGTLTSEPLVVRDMDAKTASAQPRTRCSQFETYALRGQPRGLIYPRVRRDRSGWPATQLL